MKKRFLSLLMVLLLIFTIFSASLEAAASDINYTNTVSYDTYGFNPATLKTITKNDIESINNYLDSIDNPDSEQAVRLKIAVAYLNNSGEQSVEYSATAPVYDTTEMSVINDKVQRFRYNVNMKVLSVALPHMEASNIYYGALYKMGSETREGLLNLADDSEHIAEVKVKKKVSDFSVTINRTNTELGLRTSVLPYVRWTDKNGKTHVLYSDESVSKSPAGWLKSAISVCLSNKNSGAYAAYISRVTKMSGMECYEDLDLLNLFLGLASTSNQVQALSLLKAYKADADKDFYYELLTDLFSFAFTTDVNDIGTKHYYDPLNDLTKVHSYSGNFGVDMGNPAVFSDNFRMFRAGSGDAFIVYNLDAGITELSVDTFFVVDLSNLVLDDSLIRFYVSPDNANWTELTNPVINNIGVSYAYYKRNFKFYNIDPINKYVRIVLPDKSVFSPMLSEVRINDVDKEDGRFEGRPAATFYVDAENGNDSNSGLLPNEAFRTLSKINGKYFQAGDKILLKSGQTFVGQLSLNGKGSSENPITVGIYGGEQKAKISSYGVAATVLAEHIVIENLEITNPSGTAGIFITNDGGGEKKDITVRNCYIHDVDVNENQFAYQSGGIVVFIDGTETAWFDDIVIENNIIENVSRVGIYLGTNWAGRPGMAGINQYVSDSEGWYPLTNCVIRGNEVIDAHGDGIMAIGAANLLIEKNIVNNAFCTTKQIGPAAVGLWTTNTNDAVMQYNDVGFTNLPAGCADGESFDIDIASVRTVVQYNYSHDNDSGFLLICNFGDGYKVSRDHIVRFNLSVNDVATAGQGVFMLVGANPNTHIYNNTIYMGGAKRKVMPVYHFGEATTDFTFTNNIFYGESNINLSWGNTGADYSNFKYNKNVFVNVSRPYNKGVTVSNSVYTNPLFANTSVSTNAPRKDVIAGFTPTRKITGAAVIENNGGKDITGASIGNEAFFGCVAH